MLLKAENCDEGKNKVTPTSNGVHPTDWPQTVTAHRQPPAPLEDPVSWGDPGCPLISSGPQYPCICSLPPPSRPLNTHRVIAAPKAFITLFPDLCIQSLSKNRSSLRAGAVVSRGLARLHKHLIADSSCLSKNTNLTI